ARTRSSPRSAAPPPRQRPGVSCASRLPPALGLLRQDLRDHLPNVPHPDALGVVLLVRPLTMADDRVVVPAVDAAHRSRRARDGGHLLFGPRVLAVAVVDALEP